jgi:Protein of unknown function (DUF1592)/Protein of unknown function (DUF1588)/Protein of unknown function (DUF1595)/Protein of unknown function (DUF1587)/Protein of unknown function (DUF1585)
MSSRVLTMALALAFGAAGSACQGASDGEVSGGNASPGGGAVSGGAGGGVSAPSPGTPPETVLASPVCQSPAPGSAPLRRLSHAEYRNTLEDLLAELSGASGEIAAATANFVGEAESLGFRNNAEFLSVSSLVAQGYLEAAERLAPLAARSMVLQGCPTQDAACATRFIEGFGARAFRRPLAPDEVARYRSLYDSALASGYDFQTGVEWVVFAMLQSTQFLYRVEFGAPQGTAYVPTQFETASRLSYLIWQSMPDHALFERAAAGTLATRAQIEAEARRMLKDPKAARLLEFFDQWLDLDRLGTMERDPAVYASLPNDLPALFARETHAFIGDLLRSPSGNLRELLTAPYSFLNADLARHYGVMGPTGSELVRVDMPGRAGVLTQGMMLAHDKPTRTSIVRRGLKLRLDVLCQVVPAPPNDVKLDLEGLGEGLTQRERLEQHRTVPACSGCHSLMDPLGVAFEGFDAVGRARSADESGKPIDLATELTSTRDSNGPVSGAVELAEKLAASQEVRDCYVTQSFRFFYGRDAAPQDQCSMAKLAIAFRDSEHSLSELIVALTQTDAFLYRPAPETK